MSKEVIPNGLHKISELDGKAPDSTGTSLPLFYAGESSIGRDDLWLGAESDFAADFSNYFCTYAFLYHQVLILLLIPIMTHCREYHYPAELLQTKIRLAENNHWSFQSHHILNRRRSCYMVSWRICNVCLTCHFISQHWNQTVSMCMLYKLLEYLDYIFHQTVK